MVEPPPLTSAPELTRQKYRFVASAGRNRYPPFSSNPRAMPPSLLRAGPRRTPNETFSAFAVETEKRIRIRETMKRGIFEHYHRVRRQCPPALLSQAVDHRVETLGHFL